MITRVIDRNFANMRLDRFLRKAFPDESLSVFFAVIRKKKVRVNGVIGKANQMLQEGDTVCIYENFKSVEADDRTPVDTLAAARLRCDESNAAQTRGDEEASCRSRADGETRASMDTLVPVALRCDGGLCDAGLCDAGFLISGWNRGAASRFRVR